MIVLTLIPSKILNRYNFSRPTYAMVSKVKNAMGVHLKKKNSSRFFALGFFNGLLPCGLVYMAIFGAMAGGGACYGALYLAFFGLGTVPLMTVAIYLGNFLKGKAKQNIVRAIPMFVVVIGLLFILRGMGLGIKYISPSKMISEPQIDASYDCQ